MEERDILTVLAEDGESFSKRQKNVARFICANSDRAAFMTAAGLADAAKVSESTVVRFSVQLGYDNYPQLRRAIQRVLRDRLTELRGREHADSGSAAAEILRDSLSESFAGLHKLLDDRNMRCFEAILRILEEAECVFLIGSDSTEPLAKYLAWRLDEIRGHTFFYSGDTFSRIQNMEPGDALISVSDKAGERAELRYAREMGARTVAMNCGVAEQSVNSTDVVFAAENVTAFVSFATALCHALCVARGVSEGELKEKIEKKRAEYERNILG